MTVCKGTRWGLAVLLILLGAKNIVYPYPYPPVGAIEDLTYYGVSGGMVVVGVGLIFSPWGKRRARSGIL